MSLKPLLAISPDEILSSIPSPEPIPPFVFEAINALLRARFRGKPVDISRDDIVKAFVHRSTSSIQSIDVPHGWLNFAKEYEAVGWVVTYNHDRCFDDRNWYTFAKKT